MSQDVLVATVYNDAENDQALYVRGELQGSGFAVFPIDLIDAVGDVPFRLVQINIDWIGEEWPKKEDDLKKFLSKFKERKVDTDECDKRTTGRSRHSLTRGKPTSLPKADC